MNNFWDTTEYGLAFFEVGSSSSLAARPALREAEQPMQPVQ
jgi:hypothetical protein